MTQSSKKILVVDDEIFLLELWQEIFSFIGQEILTANSAKAGIKVLQENDVDIVITDIKMPGSDGIFLLDYLNTEYPKKVKTFLCSGFLNESEYNFAKYNIEKIITKPFNVEDEISYFRSLIGVA